MTGRSRVNKHVAGEVCIGTPGRPCDRVFISPKESKCWQHHRCSRCVGRHKAKKWSEDNEEEDAEEGEDSKMEGDSNGKEDSNEEEN